jgi:hypothetical protein
MRLSKSLLCFCIVLVIGLVGAPNNNDPQIYVARTYDIEPPFVHQHVNVAVAIPEEKTFIFDRYTETVPMSCCAAESSASHVSHAGNFNSYDASSSYSVPTFNDCWKTVDRAGTDRSSSQSSHAIERWDGGYIINIPTHGTLDAYSITISPPEPCSSREAINSIPEATCSSAPPPPSSYSDVSPFSETRSSNSVAHQSASTYTAYDCGLDHKDFYELGCGYAQPETDSYSTQTRVFSTETEYAQFEQALYKEMAEQEINELELRRKEFRKLSARELAWQFYYNSNVQKGQLKVIDLKRKYFVEPEFNYYRDDQFENFFEQLAYRRNMASKPKKELKQAHVHYITNCLDQKVLQELLDLQEQRLNNIVEDSQEELEAWEQELVEELENLSNEDAESPSKSKLQARLAALQALLQGESKAELVPPRGLDQTTIAVLRELKIPCTNFGRQWGNALQNVIHKELISFLPGACDYYVKSQAYPKVQRLAELAIYGVDAARECNDEFKPRQAIFVSDICISLMDYAKAISRGLFNWADSTISAIAHPIDTAQEICTNLQTVATLLGYAIYYGVELGKAKLTNAADCDEKIEVVQELYQSLKTKLNNTPGTTIVESITPFVADVILFPQVHKFLSKLCRSALSELRVLKTGLAAKAGSIERAVPGNITVPVNKAKIAQQIPATVLLEDAIKAAQQVPQTPMGVIKGHAAQFATWCDANHVALKPDPLISPEKFAKRVEGVCLLFKEPERQLRALEELEEVNRFLKEAKPVLPILPGYTNKELLLSFDVDHAFLIETSFKLPRGRVSNISGFHADVHGEIAALGVLGEPGRLKIAKTGLNAKGFEEALLVLEGTQSKIKSLFPKDANWMDSAKMVIEASQNIRIKDVVLESNNRLILKGITKDQEVICLILDSKNGKVKTFYPDILETQKLMNSKGP